MLKLFILSLSIISTLGPLNVNAASYIPEPILPESCNGIKSIPQKQINYYYHHDFKKFKEFNLKITEQNNNIGGSIFNFPQGKKVVYRSSILNANPKCLKELAVNKRVETIIYLYNGNYIDEKTIPDQERQMFAKDGGQIYIDTLNFDDFMSYPAKNSEKRNLLMASIIKLIAASPGNVLIHCLGGMHRTGLIYGILQKCIQKLPLDKVIDTYSKHVGYKNKKDIGTYSKYDVQTLTNYSCSLLK